MGDVFRKVRSGQPLRIPAAAYNAFVDAAVDVRRRERNSNAGPALVPAQRGIVLVRNDSDDDIEPYHALAITGVLVQPDTEDQERTFHSRTPLTGEIATEESPSLSFVLALVLVSQGVVQTFGAYPRVTVVQPSEYDSPVTDASGSPILDGKGQPETEKATLKEQVIAVGPAASQIAIKQLGTNGGGLRETRLYMSGRFPRAISSTGSSARRACSPRRSPWPPEPRSSSR